MQNVAAVCTAGMTNRSEVIFTKIIKKGNIDLLRKTKRFSCTYCGCVFEADIGEYKSDTQYNEVYYWCVSNLP